MSEERRIKLKCKKCGNEDEFLGYLDLPPLPEMCFVDNQGALTESEYERFRDIPWYCAKGPWKCGKCGCDEIVEEEDDEDDEDDEDEGDEDDEDEEISEWLKECDEAERQRQKLK